MKLPAPAKLNLFLHITGRRGDGYHLLQTIFQFLDYSDEIELIPRTDGKIKRLKGLAHLKAEDDLIVKAAKLLQQHTQTTQGVELSVHKKLPVGGGLGGGSSDAATVLVGLNQLWGCDLSLDELATLGLQLGADVPVFVRGKAAWGEGVGEILTPVFPPEDWFVVIHPDVFISTLALFSNKELTRDCEPFKIRRFLEGQGSNVFEPVVRDNYPDVAKALDWLSTYSPARLTGSGSCIFAKFPNKLVAQEVLNELPSRWHGFVAKGLNYSPLYTRLEKQKQYF
ncbi:MAG: 4-(cytidine 5'-diphospho)-2-C-methyl-D-erythritol kinase [Cocleimonas sp.]|nr:4-(cytidine 5'-diphospho)-2-C-methyl-D-erythritol kinase [Cocleimonas sp.]